MEIINESELNQFARRHSDSRKPLSLWLEITREATWHSFVELRNTFRSADYVDNVVTFNIGGNNYRIVASVDYVQERVYILEVMTHAEYDRWSP